MAHDHRGLLGDHERQSRRRCLAKSCSHSAFEQRVYSTRWARTFVGRGIIVFVNQLEGVPGPTDVGRADMKAQLETVAARARRMRRAQGGQRAGDVGFPDAAHRPQRSVARGVEDDASARSSRGSARVAGSVKVPREHLAPLPRLLRKWDPRKRASDPFGPLPERQPVLPRE